MAKYCVTVLGLCLMYDHIHALLSAPEHDTLRQSVGETTSSRCPFSEKRRCRDLSAVMLRARREVKNTFSSSQHTNYVLLKRLMATLNTKEKEMLADYIISLYSGLDVKTLTSYYGGSYSRMLTAINSNTGSEYDIREQFHKAPDTAYSDMIRCTEEVCGIKPSGKVISSPAFVKKELYMTLRNATGAPDYQIKKFLHISRGGE